MLYLQMSHFYKEITGWFYSDILYRKVVQSAAENAHFVEVGCWLGRSAAFMAVEIVNSGKKIRFDCVDPWACDGSDLLEDHLSKQRMPYPANASMYEIFLSNMKAVRGVINPMRMVSVEAAALYPDESLDFVFLDGDHDPENDIINIYSWFPKLKVGGLLGGTDWNSRKTIDAMLPNIMLSQCNWSHRKVKASLPAYR
jgi:Methyltransferase domain